MIIKKTCNGCKVETIEDVVCDICSNSCKIKVGTEDSDFTFEYATINAEWGFASEHDLTSYFSEICEKCYFNIREKFKIKTRTILQAH